MDNKCEVIAGRMPDIPLRVIEIITPQKLVLDGLWFGPARPERAIVFVHGLTGNAFADSKWSDLADGKTAFLTFNNRGYGKINKIRRLDKRKKKGYTNLWLGETHEVFTDCVDDLQGAVDFARKRGAREIYLAGHSTGCQKSIYYLSREGKQKMVKGVILLAPMSDYAAALKLTKRGVLRKAEKEARKLVRMGKPHELLPKEIWPALEDAQRFLSLNTPDSKEEIFSYCQPDKKPLTLQKIKIPVLAVLAERDEYGDRPAEKIADWFKEQMRTPELTIKVIPNSPHSFHPFEDKIVREISLWLN